MIPGTAPILGTAALPEIVFGGRLVNTTDFTRIFTFSARSFGEDKRRRFVVVAAGDLNVTKSVRIGGIQAAMINATATVSWAVAQPTGTTGSIVIEYASAPARCSGAYWICYGLSPSQLSVAIGSTSATVNVAANGIWAATAYRQDSISPITGITSDFSARLNGIFYHAGGGEVTTTAGTKTASLSGATSISAISFQK